MDREMDGEVKLEIFVWSTCGGIPTKKYWAPLPIAWFTVFEIMPDKTRRQCGPKGNHETNIKCPFQTQVTHTEVSFQKISMVNDWRDVGDDNLVMVTMVMWLVILMMKNGYDQKTLHTFSYTKQDIYIQTGLHKNLIYTTVLHTNTVTTPFIVTGAKKNWHTKFLQTKISTHKSCWTHLFKRYLLYTSAFFTHRRLLHTQILDAGAFTLKIFYAPENFTV